VEPKRTKEKRVKKNLKNGERITRSRLLKKKKKKKKRGKPFEWGKMNKIEPHLGLVVVPMHSKEEQSGSQQNALKRAER